MQQNSYWQKQADTPLYATLLWSRPEHRSTAGKLLIIGGNAYGFAAPASAYAESQKAGIGSIRMLLPDSLHRIIGSGLDGGEFVPSTPSGSFSQAALELCLADSQWADGVLIAGDLGRNSETAILIEKFTSKYTGQLTLVGDAIDFFSGAPFHIIDRPQTAFVTRLPQLQKLAVDSSFTKAFTSSMDLVQAVERLHAFSLLHPTTITLRHLSHIIVAQNGNVSTTSLGASEAEEVWCVKAAAFISVWWLQNTAGDPFASITTAAYSLVHHI